MNPSETVNEAKTTPTSEVHPGITLPYVPTYGSIAKALERIKSASTPERFTQDFLSTKLNLKGGSPKPVIPFLKRTGFLNSDGSPTELYKQFRNESLRGKAAADAIKKGFHSLYEINEYAHDLDEKELAGLIVQATGLDSKSSTVKIILGSFKALKSYANFETNVPETVKLPKTPKQEIPSTSSELPKQDGRPLDFRLGYTINLNLPPTSDIAVFNAIFKSLREHLLEP